jgi:hypothetical protein
MRSYMWLPMSIVPHHREAHPCLVAGGDFCCSPFECFLVIDSKPPYILAGNGFATRNSAGARLVWK